MKHKLGRKNIILIGLISFILIGTTNQVLPESQSEPYEYTLSYGSIPYQFRTITKENTTYAQIQIPDHGFSQTVGSAELPVLRYYLQLPLGANPKIRIISQQWNHTSLEKLRLPLQIYPAQPSRIKNDTSNEFIVNDSFYLLNLFQPTHLFDFTEIGFIRGKRCGILEVTPVRYNPKTAEVHLLESFELHLSVPQVKYTKTFTDLSRVYSKEFDLLTENMFVNHKDFNQYPIDRSSEGYLIITPDSYYSHLLSFKQFKENQSMNVTIINTSSIPDAQTTTGIRTIIEDAYHNWSTPPTYVLLIGDVSDIPTFTGTTDWPGPADAVDLYYATVNGSDYFPDLFIGRLSVSSSAELNAILQKTMYYEQGSFNDESWVKHASFLAGNDHYQLTEATHNHVINTYLDPKRFTSDKLYEVSFGATTQDIANAVNAGRGLVVFSGHGNTYQWSDGPPFYQYNVEGLVNNDHYPVVFSHACKTGQFNYGECFAETWIRQNHSGGVAFIGASESTLWTEDDILEKGIFQGWWTHNIDTLKAVLDYGLHQVYQYYGGAGYSKYYFETYNVLGDPSLMIWRDKPSNYNDPPQIKHISVIPPIQEPGGYVNISCIISDETIPSTVTVQISYPNGSSMNIPMNQVGVDPDPQNVTYYYNSSYSSYGFYQAIISVTDSKGVTNTSESFDFTIGSIHSVTPLIHGWNFISLPLNTTVSKYQLMVSLNETSYDWNQSIQQSLINPVLFGWKRTVQSYELSNMLQSGYGYWLYANINCDLSVLVLTNYSIIQPFQNQLHPHWNTIGIINNASYSKQDMVVHCNNTSYTWSDAVNESLLSTFIFGWNRNIGSYEFISDFQPGHGYWLYAYESSLITQYTP